jgi:hypothetical protein
MILLRDALARFRLPVRPRRLGALPMWGVIDANQVKHDSWRRGPRGD